jgi:predicted transposase YbfD/YdcC
MVSAFLAQNQLVLGQIKVDCKENEIVAIPKLLELLDLSGATVSIDAIGCQREIARSILDAGANYVLAVKENQKTLHGQVKKLLDEAILEHFHGMAHDSFQETDGDHGRIETRRVWCTGEVHWVKCGGDWPGLGCVGVVECVREVIGGTVSTERRYYISSLPGTDARSFAAAVRGHWGVENPLHWSLDVTFGEDDSRVRKGHAAQNLSRLRRIALNQLQREKTLKAGIQIKRQRAGWDHDYLLKVLAS